jgi:hypothetical protein
MNHYDDLQRFKDKTRNQKYEFKDLSAQNLSPDHGSWAIMNQLAPASETSKLAMGGHVSLPQPQAIAPDVFASAERHEIVEISESIDSSENSESTESSNESVLPPVDAEIPAATAPSIFRDIAGQLASQSTAPVAPAAQPAAEPVVPTATNSPARLRQSLLIIPGCLQRKRQKQNPRSKKPTFTIFARKDRFMPLICVCSPKGGVGKTTLTANLAYALARSGSKVLALDFDVQNALRLHFAAV